MFKLFRLAIYGLVGYAAYQFVTDVLNAPRHDEEQSSGAKRGNRAGGGARMTGAKRGGGAGKMVTAENADGSHAKHRVGRGVV